MVLTADHWLRVLPSRSQRNQQDPPEKPQTAAEFLQRMRSRIREDEGEDEVEVAGATRRPVMSDAELEECLSGVVGWPGFGDVFTVSATEGGGVDELRDYLVGAARERRWDYSGDIRTPEDPRKIVLGTVRAKLMEATPGGRIWLEPDR